MAAGKNKNKIIFSVKERLFLKELSKQKVEYLLVGLSAATLQGAPVVTQDIDLWFKDLTSPALKKVLNRLDIVYVPPFNLMPPTFAGDCTELIDIVLEVHGIEDFDQEYRRAKKLKVDDFFLKVLPLEKILQSKRHLNRPKDRLVLKILEETLKLSKPRVPKRRKTCLKTPPNPPPRSPAPRKAPR